MGNSKTPKQFRLLPLLGLVILMGLTLNLETSVASAQSPWCSVVRERVPQIEFQPEYANFRIWGERTSFNLKYRTNEAGRSTESHLIIATSIRGLPSTHWGVADCRLMLVLESTTYDHPQIYLNDL